MEASQQRPSAQLTQEELKRLRNQVFTDRISQKLGHTAALIWNRWKADRESRNPRFAKTPGDIVEAALNSCNWYICTKTQTAVQIYCLTDPKLLPLTCFGSSNIMQYDRPSGTPAMPVHVHNVRSMQRQTRGFEDLIILEPYSIQTSWTTIYLGTVTQPVLTAELPSEIFWVGNHTDRTAKIQLYQLLAIVTNRDAAALIVQWSCILDLQAYATYAPGSVHCVFHAFDNDLWEGGKHIQTVLRAYWNTPRQ